MSTVGDVARTPVGSAVPVPNGGRLPAWAADAAADLGRLWRPLLVSRIVVWAAALAALILLGVNSTARLALDPHLVTQPFRSLALDRLVEPGARWDAVWYLRIASHGYDVPATAGFFPLYPLLVGLVDLIVPVPVFAGLIVSFACMTASALLLYRLARLDLPEPVARLAVSLYLFFPASLFLSAVYTESLFMALSLGAVLAARHQRWALAAACGALASASRLNGMLILLPLAILALYGAATPSAGRPVAGWWRPRQALRPGHLWLLLVPAGAVAFFAYMGIAHGAPFETLRVENLLWGHRFAGPFGALVQTVVQLPGDIGHVVSGTRPLGAGDPLSWDAHQLIDLVFTVLWIALIVLSWRRLPVAYTAYVAAMLILITTDPTRLEPLESFPRYLLTAFPLFLAAAGRLVDRPATTRWVLAISTAGLVAFSALWGVWAWVC